MEVLRLFPAVQQFQVKNGAINTDGRLYVYFNGSDDLADCFDVDGSRIAQPVILDNNGRAPGLFVDGSKVYRLEVQDRYGNLLFTVRNMVPTGGGAGSALGNNYDVVSIDGSISVDKSVDAGTTTFDIGLAPNDSDEFLEWIDCSEEDCGETWYPVYQEGTMETEAGQGIKVHGGHLYHFTNTFIVSPDGTGINYDTFSVLMYCGDEIVETRRFDIDSSLHDSFLCEFSRDVVPTEDTHVYFKLSIPATCEVSGEVQCHRIYSGINAVPDTCATKQWVQETFDMNLSSKVDYSAIEYNQYNEITGISGSAIAGGINSAMVSSIASSVASSYTESAFSSISSWTAEFSSISSKADSSSLSAYQPVSAMSGYATEQYVDSAVSSKLDTSAFASASAGFQPSGNYAYNSSLSAYYPASASGAFQPSGNYQTAGDYAYNSSVSSKLDASASSNFVVNSAMTSWIPYSALDYSGTAISGIGGSSLAGMGGGGGADYTGVYPVNVDNTAREISVDSLPLVTDSSMTAYGSAGSSVIGVNLDIMSGKLDSSAQVVTATATQLYAGTTYVTSVNGTPISAARAGNAANASMANSAYYDGTGRLISALPDSATVSAIASSYVESGVSSKQDTLSFAYNTADQISSINGSALAGTTYSAGTGIDITDDVISVETPVDIVAGPGIVIDNPDGNTLRVSTDEDYEKELYVNTTVPYTNVDDVFTLSEPVTNFERIRVESWNREFQQYQATFEFTISGSTTSTVFVMSMDHSESTSNIQRLNMRFSYNSDGNLVDKGHILFFGNGSSSASGNQRGLGIHRVVGIHRIAGGN